MLAFAAERGGNVDDPHKRDPLDFVLWQPSPDDEPAWESLWGPGRPGWHIECSALALRELGTTIDLHGGGADLIFPHHECEAAQSEAATGEPFVRHWMHQAMVRMDGEKMSKSLGNLVFVTDLLKEWDPMAIRLVLVEHHYRDGWEWDEDRMPRAAERLERWRAAGDGEGGARRGPGRARRRPRHPRGGGRDRRRRRRRARACRRPPPSLGVAALGSAQTPPHGRSGVRAVVSTGSSTRSPRLCSRPIFRGLWRITATGARAAAAPPVGRSSAPTTPRRSTRFFLPLVLPRRITFVGKAEYMDSWKTKHLFPAWG